ncbi:EutN/CcmL family microcompartment protein [Candidatus Fermentibacteria bacterium]|nr:EutN/CcmL family microcompartment protein [Candidatus Fermentibacteria bacterium]
MILGRVTGEIVATIKHEGYRYRKLLVVERIDPAGSGTGGYIVAVDVAGAGVGERVLVIDEGNSARQILGGSDLPIRSVVVGIVDAVSL